MKIASAVTALLLAGPALATEYECKVTSKLDSDSVYTAQQVEKGQYSVRITDDGKQATISRCSFAPSQQKVTCDTYDVDKVALDRVTKIKDGEPVFGEYVFIKKYYRFTGQFDVQVFPNLDFVENNGRGGIAYGKCSVVSP